MTTRLRRQEAHGHRSLGAHRRRHYENYPEFRPMFEELVRLADTNPRRPELQESLVHAYLPLAEHIAQRYSGRGVDRDDLAQVATIGLINAVDRFDPDRGRDFLVFAVPTIRGEVRRYFRDRCWAMQVPRRLKDLQQSVSRATDTLTQRLGRAPKPSEIADFLGVDRADVTDGLAAEATFHLLRERLVAQ